MTEDGILVSGALPGEVVEGEISDRRIPDPKIVSPSPDRVKPLCPHAKPCGGCSLQHAQEDFVAEWKVDVVRRALAAHGLEAPFRPIATSPARSRRRAVLSGRRLKSGAVVGFHARRSDTVVAIPECNVLDPAIVGGIPAFEELTALLGSRKGEVGFAVTVSEAGLDLDVRGGKEPDGPLRITLASIADRHDLARLSIGGEVIVTRRVPLVPMGSANVVPPPGAFLQATREGEAALTAAVLEAVGDKGPTVDLFAGAGTFSLPLAARMPVHAVEGDHDLLHALEGGWRKTRGLKPVTTEKRDLFRRPLMPDELSLYKAAVIDPPRAGAEAQTRELAASGIGRVAAVSCNPQSFARDMAILTAAGFSIDWIQVVDQFRWSPHVEIAAALSRT